MQDYLEHLHEERWVMIRHINGKGLEVSNNKFNVLPKAIKAVHEDDPIAYKDYARFIIKDFNDPVEVEDGTLNYVFITLEDIPYDTIKKYLDKLLPEGKLLVHTKDSDGWKFLMYQYDNGNVILSNPCFNDLPEKNVGIIRYGAIGDLLQTTSVTRQFKKLGYHVTVYAQNPAADILRNNPDIDQIIATDREVVRNNELRLYWDWLAKQHTKLVNLAGSVEDVLLPGETRPQFYWPYPIRHKYLNTNYVQFMHELAGIKYNLDVKFHPTQEEIEWAKEERKKFKEEKLIMWALNGSSVHKVFPHFDEFVARVMLLLPNVGVVTLGDERAQLLEAGWENEPRVYRTSGTWTIRQSLTFVKLYGDLVIGPETGILNSVATEKMPKIIFLSHSSVQNLTRDWKNTYSMVAPAEVKKECDNCCMHRLHMWDSGFTHIKMDEETGVAHCQAKMNREELWIQTIKALK